MNQLQDKLGEVLADMKILKENKGKLKEDVRFSLFRYLEGSKFGLEMGIKELNDLQGAYDIAIKEIARLRKLLGYDANCVVSAPKEDSE